MRILYDSHNLRHKSPFGALAPEELCAVEIHIPLSCRTLRVWLLLRNDRTGEERPVALTQAEISGDYAIWRGTFSLPQPDLYFYWFRITTEGEEFSLYKWGEHDTNMEAGELWQLSCCAKTFPAPDWARGAVAYQIFPDRFFRSGDCDCRDKLRPYTLHACWDEQPQWQPAADGEIYNNDFFGGNLRGIREKLPYLHTLGVELIYLNPIFMAFSNHRYDTCDYGRIDPLLGTEEDFADLCAEAHALGIRIVLDGVFSHTGSRSVYFDREGEFGGGAFRDPQSPYRSWFQFREDGSYESWWGFLTLPCVRELDPAYLDFIVENENSILAKWIRLGADGFRLDVADELPDEFILRLRRRLRQLKPDALLLGEVWEDASNKTAYGQRRRYFVDGELDGVMNYPWREAILRFCRGEDDGTGLARRIETLAENYPEQVLSCTLSILSGHDVPRALTELAAPFSGSRAEMAAYRLTPEQRETGLARLRLASALLFALPGMPCIYYGDEAGVEGCTDPFNRGTYPWGREEASLRAHFAQLGQLRRQSAVLRRGGIRVLEAGNGHIVLCREAEGHRVVFSADAGSCTWEFSREEEKAEEQE